MSIQVLTARAFASSLLAISVTDSVTTDSLVPVESISQCESSVKAPISTSAMATSVKANHNETWSAKKNLRFKELVRAEALGKIGIEEIAELEKLTRLRRFEKYPRSADEILWQRQQQKLTQQLLQSLEEYVDFHSSTARIT